MAADALFVKRLQSERLRLKLSRSVVAECMGVQSQTLIQYEKGITSPTLSNVRKLKKLGFNIDFLLDIENSSPIKKTKDFDSKVEKAANTVDDVAKLLGFIPSEKQRLELSLLFLSKF